MLEKKEIKKKTFFNFINTDSEKATCINNNENQLVIGIQ